MKNGLTVADFFCGAGGFSEGFRQAGFDIVFALDHWEAARRTHKLNHPSCNHPEDGDILMIPVENIDDFVPDVDVIIGSPPCVTFSSSNKAGKADKSEGIELIKKFLQIIAVKKHNPKSRLRYWLMENVPNSREHILREYTFKDLGLKKDVLNRLGIKKKEGDIALTLDNSENNIYNSVDYGVPQRRERFICGQFPRPEQVISLVDGRITLGHILNSFRGNKDKIKDPNYGYEIPKKELTDHFYNTEIPQFEWQEAKIKKQQARYYGKMPFPEDESKPGRTIMATRSIIAREAMILSNGKPNVYRYPTIREVASIMSFPITYLFYGKDEATKYRLVGNAVCPKLAFSFAKAILKEHGSKVGTNLIRFPRKPEGFIDLRKSPPKKKQPRPKHPDSNFAEIVPDMKYRNFRVELDNNLPRLSKKRLEWRASIHHATGKENMKSSFPSILSVRDILLTYEDKKKIKAFLDASKDYLTDKIPPSAKVFQKQHCSPRPKRGYLTPRATLRLIKSLVDKHFPEQIYKDISLKNINIKGSKYKFIVFDRGSIPEDKIPLRTLAALYALTHMTNRIKKP